MPEPAPGADQPPLPRLLRASQDGDRSALAQLLERCVPMAREYLHAQLGPRLRALESESDVLQSVCADVLAMPGIAFDDEEGFRRWFRAAVLNKLRNHDRHFRAQRRDVAREEPIPESADLAASSSACPSPSRELMARERSAALAAALDRLPAHYQEVVRRVKVEGMSYEATAQVTGRSVDSVRNILARALTRLAELLDPEGGASDQGR